MMNSRNSDFVSTEHIKVEHITNDHSVEDKQRMNFVSKNGIKCKNKCFDIVDKWMARVVVTVPTGNNWHNIVAREIALLKVRYPFLTEQQLRGKAFVKFGIPSMCGKLIRTGAGKVKRAIAIDLSRNYDRTRRIPAAFKVLKHFLPCMNKFDEKPVTNIWIRENHRTPTLYDRKTTSCTKEIIQAKIMKPEIMEKSYWRPPQNQSVMPNPMNKLHSSYSFHSKFNNTSQEISCSVLTPKKKHPLMSARKALLPIFNDTDMKFLGEKNMIVPERKKIKQEAVSPDSKRCLRMIASNFKENLYFDDSKYETFNGKLPKKEMSTYSQLSQDSREILTRFQVGSQSGRPCSFDDELKRTRMRPTNNNNITVEKKGSKIKQFELDDPDSQHRKQSYSECSLEVYEAESPIRSYQYENSYSPVSLFGTPAIQSRARSPHQKIKRQNSESVDFCTTPEKIVRYGSTNYFHDIYPDNTDRNQYRQSSQTVSVEGLGGSSHSESKWIENSRSNAKFFLQSIPFEELPNSFEVKGSEAIFSTLRQRSVPTVFESPSISNQQCSHPSASGRDFGASNYICNEMESQIPDFEDLSGSIGSETSCTLTPPLAKISLASRAPSPSPPKDTIEILSPDLLDRENITQIPLLNRSISYANTSFDVINCNIQSIIERRTYKSFKLSDFCSEYDNVRQQLEYETPIFTVIDDISVRQNRSVSMTSIKKRIEHAIRRLDADIDNIFE